MTHQICFLAKHAYGGRSQDMRHFEYDTNSKEITMLAAINVMCWGIIVGCESDPLLAPQPVEEEKGSYGLNALPGTKISWWWQDIPNPELF